jgi:hypothetical protein
MKTACILGPDSELTVILASTSTLALLARGLRDLCQGSLTAEERRLISTEVAMLEIAQAEAHRERDADLRASRPNAVSSPTPFDGLRSNLRRLADIEKAA